MAAFVSRYARAFADAVAEFHLGTPEVEKQLNDFIASWDGSAELREVFSDPSVPAVQKIAVLDAARKKALQRVLEAKLALESEAQAARKTLMASADQLAEQVVRAVMPAAAGGSR